MSSAIDSFSNDGDEASPAAIGTDADYYEEEEAWERAVESTLEEKFQNLEHLSVANIGVSSLERFPSLRNLQRLTLSDNRISGGLEFLVEAGLDSLRDLDLSNNRIQLLEDLAPLALLRLVSLDLYECPVTRIKDYRSKVFGMIRSLKYLDKMDADENERPESDDEEEEEEKDEIDGDDLGSGEIVDKWACGGGGGGLVAVVAEAVDGGGYGCACIHSYTRVYAAMRCYTPVYECI